MYDLCSNQQSSDVNFLSLVQLGYDSVFVTTKICYKYKLLK